MIAKVEDGWGGKDWEFRISRCKLLYIGWINSKVLLYSTGNYIQYPVINHIKNMKKNMKKNAYICITESLCCTAETNTALQINYTSIKSILKNKIVFLFIYLCKYLEIPESSFYQPFSHSQASRLALSNPCLCSHSRQSKLDLTLLCTDSHSQSHVSQT